ncbi:MAG TPA: hypothetical protein VFA86_06555 [Gammaproteobacteria bacterium]|nr:hypothetical protein [Gammaproteobacteria bacterium]
MTRTRWNAQRPTSLRHALELCLNYARAIHNRSVENVADLMGLPSHWTIYKWVQSGRIPAILIRPFEHACGCDFITRYIATSDHKLLIDIPSGRTASDQDLMQLQADFSESVGLLIRFYQDGASATETLASLNSLLENLAFHRANVHKASQPELGLFDGEDE